MHDHSRSRHARNPVRQALAGGVRLLVAASVALAVGAVTEPLSAEAASASLSIRPGTSTSAVVGSSVLDGSATATFQVPSSRARVFYSALQFRGSDSSQGYRARLRVLADGKLQLGFSRVRSGQETLLMPSQPTGLTVAAGQRVRLDATISGTTAVALAVRAYVAGTAAPAWQQRYTDSSASRLTTSGAVRSWAYLGPEATSSTTVAVTDASASPTASAATVSTTATTTTTGKPSASSTGVPSGTALKQHYGNIVVTKSGTVLDSMDIHGFVTVRATNVRITRSIVRGGSATSNTGLITNYGYAGLVIEDVDLKPERPSVWIDGIKGNNFIARRVHVVGGVDSVKIHGDNVQILNSLLENTQYYASDPNQGGGATHNDNIQILNGRNLTIRGNTIRGATNFGVLGGAEHGPVPNLVLENNYIDGGYCTVKLQVMRGYGLTATARGNKFGPNRTVKACAFQAQPAVSLTASANVFEVGGAAVTILRK